MYRGEITRGSSPPFSIWAEELGFGTISWCRCSYITSALHGTTFRRTLSKPTYLYLRKTLMPYQGLTSELQNENGVSWLKLFFIDQTISRLLKARYFEMHENIVLCTWFVCFGLQKQDWYYIFKINKRYLIMCTKLTSKYLPLVQKPRQIFVTILMATYSEYCNYIYFWPIFPLFLYHFCNW